MRTLLCFAFILEFICVGLTQNSLNVRFTITILDSAVIENVQRTTFSADPQFADEVLNKLFENYEIFRFERTYPESRYRYLRDVWTVECDSVGLMNDLMSTRPDLFIDGRIDEEIPQITYSPNDYGLATSNLQKDLDLIRAKEAWDITKGDPNIVIGITDTKFNIDHEDLDSQIINVRYNNPNNQIHGTLVAGAAAANTDNNIGISGIGFNCKLDVSSYWGSNNEMLNMSNDGIRILNGSWINGCITNLGFDPFLGQGVYNEIYENGTIACFGAGNGYGQCKFKENFPASYDHNISVSSVGCETNYGQKSWWPGLPDSIYWGMKDVHWDVVKTFPFSDIV